MVLYTCPSGQRAVPILVLDDETVVAGPGRIVAWARANPAAVSMRLGVRPL